MLQEIPAVRSLIDRFAHELPLAGMRMSGCLLIATEPANLAAFSRRRRGSPALRQYPLSMRHDLGAALVSQFDILVYAVRGENMELYYEHYYEHVRAALYSGRMDRAEGR